MPDDDGYPTDEELEKIHDWEITDTNRREVFTFIKSIWHYAEWGWHECDQENSYESWHEYRISTGGWSGNEDIISTMKSNWILWVMSWQESRRGGHFVFRVDCKLKDRKDESNRINPSQNHEAIP